MTGGTIADGTYVLTGWTEYNGDHSSSTHKETFKYTGGSFVHSGSDNGAPDSEIGGTYTTSGTTLTWNITCPSPSAVSVLYTATPTAFTFIAPDNANQVQTYTKQ